MKKLIFIPLFLILAFCGFAQKEFTKYTSVIPGSKVSFTMVPIPAGSFEMGSPATDKTAKKDEKPQQTITLSAFWMCEHEVTFDEFQLFYEDATIPVNSEEVDAVTRPTPQYIDFSMGMGKQGGFPVNSMSQYTAIMYCKWLYSKTGVFYRLPTEAEWEYACRAGSKDMFYFGNDSSKLGDYAWFVDNGQEKFHKVMQKKPNQWGLYDMMGNLSEWTLDQYDNDYLTKIAANAKDPLMPPGPKYPRSIRGGCYEDPAINLRSAARNKSIPYMNRRDPQVPKSKWWLTDAGTVGFRIVSPVQQPTAAEAAAFYSKY